MPHLILTPGDPEGIGPEITVKALQRLGEFPNLSLTVVGSVAALEDAARQLKLPLPQNDAVRYQPIDGTKPGDIAYRAIDVAVRMIAAGEGRALVTGPISKRNLFAAGHKLPGHTEILEKLANKYFDSTEEQKIRDLVPPKGKRGNDNAGYRAEMLFVFKKLRLLLLTRHIALNEVPAALAKPGAIAAPLKTLIAFLRHQLHIDTPRIALLGVNPHAGEIGGEEEKKLFAPVIKAVNGIGASELMGPFPADGFFRGFDAAEPRL